MSCEKNFENFYRNCCSTCNCQDEIDEVVDDYEYDYDFTNVEGRIVFLEYIKRKLYSENVAQKIVYFGDTDLHEELDEEYEYHANIIDRWVKELQCSN